MNAVIYVRVSTDEQGLSIGAQEDVCRGYAERHGLPVASVHVDENLSGATPITGRGALLEAIAELPKGGVLLVARRDRLARDRMVIAMIEASVRRKKARIVSAAGEGTEGDGPGDALHSGMIDLFAEYERALIQWRTRNGLRKARKLGQRTGQVPYGWDVDPEAGVLSKSGQPVKLRVNRVEQARRDQMLEMHAKGITPAAIARFMNAASVPTKTGKGRWRRSTVWGILNDKGPDRSGGQTQ